MSRSGLGAVAGRGGLRDVRVGVVWKSRGWRGRRGARELLGLRRREVIGFRGRLGGFIVAQLRVSEVLESGFGHVLLVAQTLGELDRWELVGKFHDAKAMTTFGRYLVVVAPLNFRALYPATSRH